MTVSAVGDLSPRMRRITFTSPDLRDFQSWGADDHVKIFLPDPASPGGTSMRDYTPRYFDAAGESLTIDFALHDTGIATDWARGAKPGDRLAVAGPRGSAVVSDDFDHYLLVGDETALPAIGRRLEGLRPGVPVTTIMVVEDAAETQHIETRAHWQPVWLCRNGGAGGDATLLLEALKAWQAPAGDGYAFVAAEAAVARLLKDYLLDVRHHPKAWLKAAGYWVKGAAGATDKMEN
ncbi:NADPH-dependent ferric siderophore reductase [Zavarzinia compransoris]|uniref:NADPH-dependent ferric siderophore reductase n=1 Tax=Zavarzinia compransoris TaxID=1264899 RepID=A0A317E0Y7_9PROT|nr:NADPH-dependent ferric siderophore reductase [Zavarzinia compransoris]